MSTQDGKYWDVSFNPWIGCSRISEACKHCWAGALRNRFAADNGWPDFYAGPVYQPNAIEKLRHWKKPRTIFVGDMTDLWHPVIDPDERGRVLGEIAEQDQHTYLLLTKRPHAINEGMPWPFWIGFTAENQQRWYERHFALAGTMAGAYMRWVSFEPLLGPIEMSASALRYLQWVVIGCLRLNGNRTGMDAQRDGEWYVWARNLVRQCTEASVPVWVKQIPLDGKVVTDLDRFPNTLQYRQKPEE